MRARSDEALVRCRDGVRLATDVYLPSGPGPFPTILTRTPYDMRAYPRNLAATVAQMTERGYAFVAQDVRGKHRSEGELAAFVAELPDAYDTLEWLCAQRWCNGRIGMWGDSYCGFTQWAAVASGHPALGAIVPANTAARIDSLIYRQGLFELAFAVPWAASSWVDAAQGEFEAWHFDWSMRPLRGAPATVTGGRDSASLRRWADAGAHGALWTHGIYRGRDPLAASVPALHIGGWWDLFRHVQAPEHARARGFSSAPRWLIMDATDHGLFEFSPTPGAIPDGDWWDSEELVARIPERLAPVLDFYDRVLAGAERVAPAPVRWRLTRAGWREADAWPPPDARRLCLHLGAGDGERAGVLRARADAGARWSRWVHDPEALVPSLERTPFVVLLDVPRDERLSAREDVLSFYSEPLRLDLDLGGPVTAELVVGSSAPAMHVVAKLLDVDVDGSMRRICDGGGAFDTAAGELRAAVSLGDVGYRVRAGHRLCVQISSSDFPRYLPYPGDERDPWDAVAGVRNEQRLRIGGGAGSRLWLTRSGDGAGALPR